MTGGGELVGVEGPAGGGTVGGGWWVLRGGGRCQETTPILQAKEKTDAFYDELSKVSGCDLLCATPLIRNWIVDVHKNYLNGNEKLVIGNYTYLDGALHVQLSVACNVKW